MAPALARLSPARGAAGADAQPEAARDRRARSAGNANEPRAETLARLVCERNLARDALPFGRHRPNLRGSTRTSDSDARDRAPSELPFAQRGADRRPRPPARTNCDGAVRGDPPG